MGRADQLLVSAKAANDNAVEAEVEVMSTRPDDIPEDVWQLVQENGRLATERLNELLASPKFPRMRASDQAKLIALAQNRAYGMPKSNSQAQNKRRGNASNVTQAELNALVHRATLPEYKRSVSEAEIEDAEILPPES